MSALHWLSAVDLVRAYRNRSLSPLDVTRALLDRIAALDGEINSFCFIDRNAALGEAGRSEQRWLRGEPLGRLDGVPVGIKDLILTQGQPTLRGSLTVDPDQDWADDAPSVASLRAHGAILLGKTTSPEFGWKGVTDSPLTGITRNPWNMAMTPGGSSGGASAALAAGFCPLASGTDGGGSIRIPASFAGVVGHKPSFGRVPAWPTSPFGTVAHVGPMARTVADCALMLQVMAEPDARDWYALPHDGRDVTVGLDDGVAGLRIAYSADLGYAPVMPEIAQIVARAVATFSDLGARVEAVDPGFEDPAGLFRTHWYAGAAAALSGLSPEKKALLEPELLAVVEEGQSIGLVDYLQATQARAGLGAHMRQFHQDWDLLVTPSISVPAFPVGQLTPSPEAGMDWARDWTAWTPFSFPFNLTQQPAISIPCGFTADGLPVGLQIVGPMHNDALVLRAARAFEAATPWHHQHPAQLEG